MVSLMPTGKRSCAILLMGVAGCGKSSVGPMLAATMGGRYIEGDAFHSTENQKKMAAGKRLVDMDRWLWLDQLKRELELSREKRECVVLGCSALKQRYRQRLREGNPDLITVWLDVPKRVLEYRIQSRMGHFFPLDLLETQLRDLEPPKKSLKIDATLPIEGIVSASLDGLKQLENQ